jgi:hypothetical protein
MMILSAGMWNAGVGESLVGNRGVSGAGRSLRTSEALAGEGTWRDYLLPTVVKCAPKE